MSQCNEFFQFYLGKVYLLKFIFTTKNNQINNSNSTLKEILVFEKWNMLECFCIEYQEGISLYKYFCTPYRSFQEVKKFYILVYIPSTGGVTFLPIVMDAFSSYMTSSGASST